MTLAAAGTDTEAAPLGRAFFERGVLEVARDLVGATLLVEDVGGTIVEVEAYAPNDPASHSFRGRTERNAAMFGPAGHAYVYRSYGTHWCFNAVCGDVGVGAAVLVRALAPELGVEEMRTRRRTGDELLLCSGPGRLTEALGIAGAHDGLPLDRSPFTLFASSEANDLDAVPRVGISRAADLPWRYVLRGSRFLSRAQSRA